MDTRVVAIPVVLKGPNYVLWSRMARVTLGSKGLCSHLESDKAPTITTKGDDGKPVTSCDEEKWLQEDLLVMTILQASLDVSILEAYSFCVNAKALWETLEKVYGNTSNLSRVFEVKRALNTLNQDNMEFTKHFGRFNTLWAELETLRPQTIDPAILNKRREEDKVFGLLQTLDHSYKDLVKHILRADKLPSLEEVCAQIQKEQGSIDLFEGKKELSVAHRVVDEKTNQVVNKVDAKKGLMCDHCKKKRAFKRQVLDSTPSLETCQIQATTSQ